MLMSMFLRISENYAQFWPFELPVNLAQRAGLTIAFTAPQPGEYDFEGMFRIEHNIKYLIECG